ncbi:hypothetical protein [Nocardioides flavescens]|uniref:Uncharacterized protein n=1 Tax=Nocardioides flavescens TaxID=2691959 RepID=A0A6L7F479_9ACTN|nr:hypothetical protein [Nocardioides flavescens]MXG92063.1 hypothetical protein [Nocardioides flavescens]
MKTNENKEAVIRDWLTKTGFPLELRVAREARRSRAHWVEQSRGFVDPETEKVRETDVVVGLGPERSTQANVVVVAECKAKPVPFIVFDDGGLLTDDARRRMTWAVSAAPRNEYGDGLYLRLKERAFTGGTLLGPSLVGFGIVAKEDRQKGQERNSAWDAVRSAVSAAHGLGPEFDSKTIENGDSPLLIFPVVVTTGELMRAYLSGDDLTVESVDRAEVLVRTAAQQTQVRCFVIRESAWPQLLREAQATTELFDVED